MATAIHATMKNPSLRAASQIRQAGLCVISGMLCVIPPLFLSLKKADVK